MIWTTAARWFRSSPNTQICKFIAYSDSNCQLQICFWWETLLGGTSCRLWQLLFWSALEEWQEIGSVFPQIYQTVTLPAMRSQISNMVDVVVTVGDLTVCLSHLCNSNSPNTTAQWVTPTHMQETGIHISATFSIEVEILDWIYVSISAIQTVQILFYWVYHVRELIFLFCIKYWKTTPTQIVNPRQGNFSKL